MTVYGNFIRSRFGVERFFFFQLPMLKPKILPNLPAPSLMPSGRLLIEPRIQIYDLSIPMSARCLQVAPCSIFLIQIIFRGTVPSIPPATFGPTFTAATYSSIKLPNPWGGITPAAAMVLFHLALAPNGQSLIAAKPVSRIEDSWSHFTSRSSEFSFENLPRTEARGDRDWSWPWEYVYVDLKHNMTIPIVHAPSAWIAGYEDAVLASWSPDGSQVLLTNTFLPVSELDTMRETIPCAVAVATVATPSVQCIAYSRAPRMRLTHASFRNGPNQIELSWMNAEASIKETYRNKLGHWTLAETVTASSADSASMAVSVHQDLNQPPALWVTDSRTGVSKKLWDPNPQLATFNLGRASVFHWRDASGYTWTAGLLKPYGYIPGHHYPLVIQTHGFEQHEFLVDGSYTTGFVQHNHLPRQESWFFKWRNRHDRHLKPVSEEATSFASGCAAAIQQLITDGLIDPSKIGIIGFSRASWYVETALEMYPKLFKVATIIDGIDQGYASYILLCPGLPSCKSDHLAANGGPPLGKDLLHWVDVAPSFNLNKMQGPLRIEAIRWFSILEEWEIYSSLYQQGKPVDLIYIPDGQHILQQPQQRLVSQQGNVDWFRFWLQGYEAPDSEKKDEYQRWKHLTGHINVGMAMPAHRETK